MNSVTRQSGAAVLVSYESAAVEEDDVLHIDRAALRAALQRTEIQGLIGGISCDAFGDCGTGRVNIYHHTDSEITDIAELPIVFRYVPSAGS